MLSQTHSRFDETGKIAAIDVIMWIIRQNRPVPNYNKTRMMTSTNRNIFRVSVHLYGEFTGPW